MIKKITAISAALVAGLSLTACGGGETDDLGTKIDARTREAFDSSVFAMQVISNRDVSKEFKASIRMIEAECRRQRSPTAKKANCNDQFGFYHFVHGKTASEIIDIKNTFESEINIL